MRDSVPSTRYSSVCNVLRQWNIPLIPTYRVYRLYDYRLYDIYIYIFFLRGGEWVGDAAKGMHNTVKLYASARTRPLNSRPRALALAMYLHIFILRIWARRR